MSISMYQASVPVFIRMLNNLQAILGKASAHADSKRLDAAILPASRLFPDMFPLARQIQIASDTAKGCGARLSGQEPPRFEDNESTLPELQERLRKTVDYLQSLNEAQFADAQSRAIELKFPNMTLNFTGESYLLQFVLPNFYFHVSTAYNILRHNGVELGKRDFLGG